MNDQVSTLDTTSPDTLETQDKGNGARRLNRLPVVIISILMVMVLLSFVYTGHLRSSINKAQAATQEQEKYRVSGVVAPPIQKPEGPDAPVAGNAPVYNAASPVQGPVPVEPDAIRQAREKKAQELDAAMKADTRIEGFAPRQVMAKTVPADYSQPQMPQMIPPPGQPAPQSGNVMDAMMGGSDPQSVRNHAGFVKPDDGNTYLQFKREAPLSPYQINPGFMIPGVMITGINSDLPGPIVGQVRQNVYDSATGRYLLIPAGAKLNGTYDSQVVAGEERVLIAWTDIVFPDGSILRLNSMPGADQSGFSGFNDQVDNHYARTFGQALLLSVLTAGMQIGQQPRGQANGQLSATQIAAAAAAMQFGYVGMQAARRGLNTPPTMVIRPGFLFNIMVTKNIVLPPWQGHPMARR